MQISTPFWIVIILAALFLIAYLFTQAQKNTA